MFLMIKFCTFLKHSNFSQNMYFPVSPIAPMWLLSYLSSINIFLACFFLTHPEMVSNGFHKHPTLLPPEPQLHPQVKPTDH